MAVETVALGRPKRSTAGNRMRDLLDKAHQQDEEELFAEVEDDEEFAAPQEIRDVYLDDFADTEDEVELDEEAAEREMRREERRKAKGKSKAIYNPHLTSQPKPPKPKQAHFPTDPTSSPGAGPSSPLKPSLLDPGIDPSTMAPTTLILELRKKRREAKRANRSEARRSNLRASTLKTEDEVRERALYSKLHPNRKGRKALHEGGEVRGVRKMTQGDLIAAALEEEERNKEELAGWLRREEERRELRRVGRKRVKGPRWTWISRTVGRAVEMVGEEEGTREGTEDVRGGDTPIPVTAPIESSTTSVNGAAAVNPTEGLLDKSSNEEIMDASTVQLDPQAITEESAIAAPSEPNTSLPAPTSTSGTAETPRSHISTPPPLAILTSQLQPRTQPQSPHSTRPPPPIPHTSDQPQSQPYTRNYLILQNIPGGLPAELSLVLGNHIDWSTLQYIPARNRPIVRRPVLCPFTGLVARYRHPGVGIGFADKEGYRRIEEVLGERYVWITDGLDGEEDGDGDGKGEGGGWWGGGEGDMRAEGMEGVVGWDEGLRGGWWGGEVIPGEEGEGDVQGDGGNEDRVEAAGGGEGEADGGEGGEKGRGVNRGKRKVDEHGVSRKSNKKGKGKGKMKGG